MVDQRNTGAGAFDPTKTAKSMWNELIDTILAKDPAARSRFEVVLCYPGFHAVAMHSIAHWLWLRKQILLARFISHLGRLYTGIEIHPGATIGRRVFIDHGMGVVIGETAIVGDDCVIYQGATLGTGVAARMGSATRGKKRHPTLGKGVVVGSGAEVQGDVRVGDYARIASGSIVLKDVPPNSVVVGMPGRIIYQDGQKVEPETTDMEAMAIKSLYIHIQSLEKEVQSLRQLALGAKQVEPGSDLASKAEFVTQVQENSTDAVEKFLNGTGI